MDKVELGNVPAAEQERFEEEYLVNNRLFAELLVVEAELIDCYGRHGLNEVERQCFENYFLQSKGRK